MVGDHLYVSAAKLGVQRLLELAEAESCSASGVQPTRESLLPRFGAVAGRRVPGRQGLYRVDTVIEKPTPTEAEQRLVVPGIRAGYYLCFFGIHVLTPTVMDLLGHLLGKMPSRSVTLSVALAELARREQYLALEDTGKRYDLGARYGLLVAQLALALNGRDRDEVLSHLLELLAERDMATSPEPQDRPAAESGQA
jgi:UTP--glucose-1-phosphate uridylyltransferase